jgi:hypothetical protein
MAENSWDHKPIGLQGSHKIPSKKELIATFWTWLMQQLSLSDTRAIELDEFSLTLD